MGSEVSAEENNGHQSGDVKKDDDLHENGTETSEKEKDTKPTRDEKQQNGDLRNRKSGNLKGTNKTKNDPKRSVLRTKPPSRKEHQRSLGSKLMSVVNTGANVVNRVPWLVKLVLFCCVVGLAFVTRFFNVAEPAHIWFVYKISIFQCHPFYCMH